MDKRRTCRWEYLSGQVCGKKLDKNSYFFCKEHLSFATRIESCSLNTADTKVRRQKASYSLHLNNL